MKTIFILSIVVLFMFLILFMLGKYSQKSGAPGVVNGSLSRCSTKPNCVCSEYDDEVDHYIQPIKILSNEENFDSSKASATIKEMGGNIIYETDNYIAATFISRIFGFTDDFEIRFDQNNKVLHIRSASRVGYSDGGVNQKRVELFKQLLKY